MSNFKIESDGTPFNTKIFYKGDQLKEVTHVTIDIGAQNPFVQATLHIINPELVVDLKKEGIQVLQCHKYDNIKEKKDDEHSAP